MKITIMNNEPVPFEKVTVGTVFKVPEIEDYCIKIVSVIDYNTGEEEQNCLRLDNYALEYCSPTCTVYPVYNAELIIPR